MIRLSAELPNRPHLDLEHADFVWHVNVVPYAEVGPALCHHHVTLRDPLHVGAVVEQGAARLCLNIVQMQLTCVCACGDYEGLSHREKEGVAYTELLISKQQLPSSFIEL